MTPKHLVAGLAAAFALAAGLPAVAHAGTMTQQGSVLTYTASPGEANQTRLLSRGTGVADLIEQVTAIPVISRTPACVPIQPGPAIRCGLTGISRIDVRLGDRGDSFGSSHPIAIVAEGGDGDDTYVAQRTQVGAGFGQPVGSSQVQFRGGSGRDTATWGAVPDAGVIVTKDDVAFDGRVIGGQVFDRDDVRSDVEVLRGTSQADALTGGPGADAFLSTDGADTLNGREGDDSFDMGRRKDGPTTVVGGPGRDTVSYAGRGLDPIDVSPDDDATPDGERGEGDRITETEVIEGGPFDDVLQAVATASVGYRLIGGRGDDLLIGGNGRDRLIGGAGADTMRSGGERDVVEARDGVTRERIECGTGTDTAEIDLGDGTIGCELRQEPFIGVTSVSPHVLGVAAGSTARLRVRWEHPVAWQRLRSVAVVLRSGRRVLGRLTLLPRQARHERRGTGFAPGVRLSRAGRAVTAGVRVRPPRKQAGRRLVLDVIATDVRGRRQVQRAAGVVIVRGAG